VNEQLNASLATLADKLNIGIDKLGPELVKLQGARVHAAVQTSGAVVIGLIVLTLLLVGIFKKIDEDDGVMVTAIIGAIVTFISSIFYLSFLYELTVYNASPIGYTVSQLLGK
jgi:hypothetical protein